jgi:hypothetical protein
MNYRFFFTRIVFYLPIASCHPFVDLKLSLCPCLYFLF